MRQILRLFLKLLNRRPFLVFLQWGQWISSSPSNNDEQNKKNTTAVQRCGKLCQRRSLHIRVHSHCVGQNVLLGQTLKSLVIEAVVSWKESSLWPAHGYYLYLYYLQFVKQLQEAPLRLIQVHTQNTKYKRATKKNWGAFSWLSTGSVVKDLQWAQAPQAFQCLLSLLLELLQHWALPALPLAGHRLRPMLAELPACWASKRNNRVFGRTRISQVRNKPVSLYVTSSKAHLKYPKKN